MFDEMKNKNIEFISRIKYALKVSALKMFRGCFFYSLENGKFLLDYKSLLKRF